MGGAAAPPNPRSGGRPDPHGRDTKGGVLAQWVNASKRPDGELLNLSSSDVGGRECALLALGLVTRPACIVLIGTMIVAGAVGHRGAGYMITNDPPGAEYTINLAVICGMFLLLGPGAISLDAILFG